MIKNVDLLKLIVVLFLFPNLSIARNDYSLFDLRCENLTNPTAIDNDNPHFSWKILSSKPNTIQKYFEIQVGRDSLDLVHGKADLWSSGKIKSDASVMVPYNGIELDSRTLCYWRVRSWSNKGRKSEWSKIARFGIGIIKNDYLKGNFIGLSDQGGNTQSPLLRRKIIVNQKATAFFHVNSLGYHEVYINGQKVGNDVLSPAVSQIDKRTNIVTYDVTNYLSEGENDIVLWLGSGWYKPTTFGTIHSGPLVRAQLDILQNKKWNSILTTDSTWKGSQTGYKDTGTWQALNFGGEQVDGKLIPVDLTTHTLDLMEWSPVVEKRLPHLIATPEMTEPNKIQQTFNPIDIRNEEEGVWIVDMGKALNGWFEMRFPNLEKGQRVILEYTDYIDKKGIFHNQDQKDIFVASGRKDEIFRNRFNHHAFRYVKISNLYSKPRKEDIKAYLIHTDFRTSSSFSCSDPELNKIHDMVQYTMKCLAFAGYMVDCPHLERAGYGGDGNSSTETLQTMYDVSPLYTNWLQSWSDVMRDGGSLPHVAPNPGAGGGGPYWCGFIVMAPWQTYLNYNDSRLIKRYYPVMKEWLNYVEKYTKDGLLTRWPDTKYRDWFLGDWLAPWGVDAGADSSVSLVNNCFISDCFDKMEKMAILLGKTEEAKDFATKRDNLNQLLHKTFFNNLNNSYSTGSQLDMTYPMLIGATPDSIYNKVKNQLFSESLDKYKGHIGVGLVGVPILTKWAIENKATDFMYDMLKKKDYPGYLHMIENGATTTWEYWSGERSRIHNCYNGIGKWFYQAVGGIRTDENNPGYKHFFIDPQIPTGVTWAKASVNSPYGEISVDWKIETENILKLHIAVPPGTSATVNLPEGSEYFRINGKLNKEKSHLAGSGKHTIEFYFNQDVLKN